MDKKVKKIYQEPKTKFEFNRKINNYFIYFKKKEKGNSKRQGQGGFGKKLKKN